MKNRLFSLALAGALSLSLVLPVGAAGAAASEDQAIQTVNALGIMVGDRTGSMDLSRSVTRAEFVTMALKAMGRQIGQAASSPYPDVPWSHWAAGYVEAGVAAGLVSGYSDGRFRPSSTITLAEGVTIALRLLDYGPDDFTGAYPTGQLAQYHSLKLDRGVTAQSAASPMTRRDAMYLFYNLMTAKNKSGAVYLETLGHKLNAAGEIDLVALVSDAMEGPLVVSGGWRDRLPMDTSGALVYRQGKLSALSTVKDGDVIYWNRAMNAIWAYRDRVTGTIQAVQNPDSPTAVTVAGRTCQIESAAAAYALSDLGEYRLGDTVTLLLGRNGAVAAVTGTPSGTGSAAYISQRIGVVTAIERAQYSDGKGGTYTSRTAVVLATDGQTYRYENQAGLSAGSLVQAEAVADRVTLRPLTAASLSGSVDRSAARLGRYPFAGDVEILDVSGSAAVRVYPQRLAGMSLNEGNVSYYHLNGAGEIDRLVLKDATGDMYAYGVVTRISSSKDGSMKGYDYDIGGTAGSIPLSSTRLPVDGVGGVRCKGDPSAPAGLYSLTALRGGTVEGSTLRAGGKTYTLADNVAVYRVKNGAYYKITLAQLGQSDNLTAWYDRPDEQGGRIRVITAAEQQR